MTLQSGRVYEIRLNNTAGTFAVTSAQFDNFRFWSPDLWQTENDFTAQPVPLGDGGVFVGGGYRQPRTVQLIGSNCGSIGSANEAYPEIHIDAIYHLFDNLQLYRNTDMFLDIELSYGSASSNVKRRYLFVKPKRWRYAVQEGTRYTAGEVLIDFVAADPDFYEATLNTVSGSASASTVTIAPSPQPTAFFSTSRLTIKIENIDGSALTNPSASGYGANANWFITDTVSASGDYWLVDHGNMTVIKSVGGVSSNAISAFTGSFFPMKQGVAPVEVLKFDCLSTSATTDDFKVTVSYRRRSDSSMS